MKLNIKVALLALSLAAPVAMAQQDSLAHSMQQTMDPQVMTSLMTGMMTNPAQMMNDPMASCAECHDGHDIARYQQGLGPMMAMMNPANWFSPQAYMNMMTGMMDPKTYEFWYNGMMSKYAGAYGSGTADMNTDQSSGETATTEAPANEAEGESDAAESQ
jgi:hypothetical protein